MFLKTLTLKGFKSFADTTVMDLEPGVTVVVGPNGSGKSNVVDAIAWVLGAQAPSAVRSQKMDDVIFAGTAKRAALGRAEVTLTLDNSRGLLPLEFNEVSVSRTLFRTGESEYAINGVACRLLDVQELLSDAGVGRQQHVIVSQGQIDSVLNARPEDRRSIIEEAAGVLKFRKRKEKSERRLEATEASLLRVQDLLREVRRQLRPLERQAEAARRHGDLVAELSALQIFLAGREIAGHRKRLETLALERTTATKRESELRSTLAELDTSVMAAEAELTARGDSGLSDELVRVEQLRERARGISMLVTERRRSYERDRGQLMDSGLIATLEADAAGLRAELDDVEAGIARLEPEGLELANDEAAFEGERAEAATLFDGIASTASAATAAAEVRGELRTLRAALESTEVEHRRVVTRRDALGERDSRLASEVENLRLELTRAQEAEEPLVGEVAEAESTRLAAEAAHEAAVVARTEAASSLARWQARVEALQLALDSARARAGAEKLRDVEGVVGTLLDLVRIDVGWEDAVEAALGEALNAVVVNDASSARRALSHLRESGTSGAVLALGSLLGGSSAVSGADAVRSHVVADRADVSALLDSLLARAVRVNDWQGAVDAVIADPTLVAVTAAGDRFAVGGWRIGVAGGGATASALDEAFGKVSSASDELSRCESEEVSIKAALDRARQIEADVQKRLDANDSTFTAATEALARVQGERREISAETEGLDVARHELDERLTEQRQRVSELDRILPSLEQDEVAEVEAARVRGEARASLEAKAALLGGRRRDLAVRSAGLLERKQFLESRLAETERRLAADASARAEVAGRRERIEKVIAVTETLAAIIDSHRHTIESWLADLHERRRRQSDEVRELATRLDQMRRDRLTAERELEQVRETSRRTEIDETEVRMRLEATVETLRRDLDVEPSVAEAAELPELPEGVSAPARVRDLERELRLMGPINPLALQEFTELQERHTFLEAQLDDVRNTRRELMRVIAAIDQEIQQVFAAAFADVSENFTTLFGMLFPGGGGRLILTAPEDLLNTGIEVEAKPGGKNVKKLSLLSGGERTLTAMAFLFAVFRSRPSPFYVMDEVEAALDDVNLHRFLGLVKEFRQDAQLIIVSHQKRTMEAGDCLLGVSMQPGGSSKVVSERLEAGS
ncbi:MAG: chromosome segregation protein SMC [Actinomycetota bacterium]|nr:chromosome segregation protein SMC [Actinomycetota bacterium]